MSINTTDLPAHDVQAVEVLLSRSLHDPPKLEDIWFIMDTVWDEMGCDNKSIALESLDEYYRHPVWLLNGLYIEQDEISMQHRNAISDWIVNNGLKEILDYGGGFGTLARLIAEKDKTSMINIYEPHPSDYSISRIKSYTNISFVDSLNKEYDCLVSVDVIEHLTDPLEVLYKMIEHVRVGRYLIIANCFYPVIKCHLPSTFYLRYSFNIFARLMGLASLGQCRGSHAIIYQKKQTVPVNWRKIRAYERIWKFIFPLISLPHYFLSRIYRVIK